MKKIRKFSKSIVFLLTLSIINLQFTSCSSETDVQKMSEKFTAKEVFRGIIFLEGEFAEEVPTLNSLKAQQEVMYETAMSSADRDEKRTTSLFGDFDTMDEEKKAVADYFTSEIDKLNPLFFDEFQATINSGVIEDIRSQLTIAANLIQTVLMTSRKYSDLNNLIELAKVEGGIDIDNYDLTDPNSVTSFNEDIETFATQFHPEFLDIEKHTAIAVVAVVVVWVFVALGVLAAVAFAGVVAVAYFIVGALYVVTSNKVVYSKKSTDPKDPNGVFLENQLIAELIALNSN